MGSSATATLAFGFNLGGCEGDWDVHEYDEDNYILNVPWFDSEDEDADFEEAATSELLRAAGFIEIPWERKEERPEDYYDLLSEAKSNLGVNVKSYGYSDGFTSYALVTRSYDAYYAGAEISADQLVQQPVEEEWLAVALLVLGLTSLQERASWLLLASYG